MTFQLFFHFCDRYIFSQSIFLLKGQILHDILGYGVFTDCKIKCGEFIVEYAGQLISRQRGEELDDMYSDDDGSFLFFFERNW